MDLFKLKEIPYKNQNLSQKLQEKDLKTTIRLAKKHLEYFIKEKERTLIDKGRIPSSEVNDFVKLVQEECITKFRDHLDTSFQNVNVQEIFKLGLNNLHSSREAPKIVPWGSPFERYPLCSEWSQWTHYTSTWPTLNWNDLIEFFNSILSEDIRDYVYSLMKNKMPYKPGTKKSFYTSNRKRGIVTIPFADQYVKHKEYPRLVGTYSKLNNNHHSSMSSEKANVQDQTVPQQSSTLVGTERHFKKALIGILNQYLASYNLRFYEWDLAACHTKILISLFPEQTPTIRKVLENDESIWTEFGRFFSDEIIHLIGGPSVLKAWSKIVAYKCLQGGSVNYEGIYKSLAPKGLSEIIGDKQEKIIRSFEQNPVLKEFNTLNKSLQDRRFLARYIEDEKLRVYHPTDCIPLFLSENKIEKLSTFHATDNLCRIASQVVVGGENWVLMMALETIRKMKIPVIPISYEYDGFLVLTEIDTCDDSLKNLNQHLQPLLKEANLFPMEFEQKQI